MMTSRNQIHLLSGVLICIGLGLTLYKYFFLHFPLLPGSVRTVWNVEAKITFEADDGPVTANLALPSPQNGFETLDETFASSGYRFDIESQRDQRRAIWVNDSATGQQNLYYNMQVTPRIDSSDQRGFGRPSQHVSKPEWLPAQYEAAESLITKARENVSANNSFTSELLLLLNAEQRAEDTHLLFTSDRGLSRANLALNLLAEASIQAHIIRGVQLRDRTHNDPPMELIEVYEDGKWQTYNPQTGDAGLPKDFFIWQRGGPSLLDVVGGYGSKIRFSVIANVIPAKNIALKLARLETVPLVDFNIYSLRRETKRI